MSQAPGRRRGSFLVGPVAIALIVIACSGASVVGPSATPVPATQAAATAAPTASPTAPAIVGEWVGAHDCERIVALLGEAGLDEFAAEASTGMNSSLESPSPRI
jgi:hypothetical protein